MASLWKRASARETRMLRIICGAVLNTFDAQRRARGAGYRVPSLAPLVRAEKELMARVNPAKAAGEHERAAVLIEALIVLGTHRKRAERAAKLKLEASA